MTNPTLERDGVQKMDLMSVVVFLLGWMVAGAGVFAITAGVWFMLAGMGILK